MEHYYDCMRALKKDIDEIKEELVVLRENFTSENAEINLNYQTLKSGIYSNRDNLNLMKIDISSNTNEIHAIHKKPRYVIFFIMILCKLNLYSNS